MKKRLTILTCFMVLCSFVFGQNHWETNTTTYNGSMSATSVIKIDGVEQRSTDLEIGAFGFDKDGNEELRGNIRLSYKTNKDRYYAYLIIYGNKDDVISFKIYNHNQEVIMNLASDNISFVEDADYGTLSDPYVINFFTPVAEVDGVKYPTFEAAIAAVKENSTLTLLDDVTISEKINVASNLTINGNGYTLTYTGSGESARAIDVTKETNGANLTVKNLTIDCTASYCQRGINYNTNGTLVLEGVTVKGTNLSYALNMPGSADNATVTISNSTLKGCIALNVWGENSQINATDSHFITVDNAEHEGYAAVKLNNDGTTSAEGSVINITGGSIKREGSYTSDSSAASNATSTGEINISDTTDVDGDVLEMVAVIIYGNNSYSFTTLAGAIEKANAGETVLLIRDAEGPGVVINKDVTIDFGGHTYTFNEGVGSTGTPSNGFQILKGNTVTLKNGKLQVAASAKDKFYTIIQNYANLTVEDMYLDGTNLDKWSLIDGDSYVVSNNSGDVSIIGNTTIIANNDGDLAFAFDACDQTNKGYSLPTVTVNTTGAIKGAVEVSATLNLTAVGEGSDITVDITGNGQLYNAIPVKGSMTKKVEGTTEGWGTISSPVGTVEHSNVSGLITNNTHDLYRYNENSMMWENVKDENHSSDFHTLNKGVGYLYANTADTDVVFEGTFISDNLVDISLGYTANELAGFHFIGNPFTHNINEKHFTTTDADKLRTGFYAVTYEGGLVARTTGTIAPMESVMIQTTGSAVLYINKKEQVSASKRGVSENNGQLQITVSNAKYSDVAYVSFNEGLGLDKINHRNAEIPMVYIPVEGVNYAIAMMNQEVTEIPVSFEAKSMGQYTIGVEAQDCEYAMMTLVDRFTGVETNLLIEDYTFMATSNDNAERFIIKLAMSNSNDGDNENFAFINNGMMYIYNIEGQGVVNVYDVTGRPVAEYNVETSANISTSDFAAGVYIIRMSDENGVKVQKIVVE